MTTETVETPSSDVSTTDSVESVTPDTTTTTATEEPSYVPNYKYKAYGKEYEVTDEWAKPLFNKDNQEHFTKLYERAGGFDHLKEQYKKVEGEYHSTRSNLEQLNQARTKIIQNLDRGDLDSVFSYLGLNQDSIFDYARKKLEYQNLPSEQKQAYDQYQQVNQRNYQYEEQIQQQRQMMEEIAMQKHELETMQVFSSPRYASVINSYNGQRGSETAFKDVVKMIGSNEFYATGKNIPVNEAVERAINFLGLSATESVASNTSANPSSFATPEKPAPKPITMIGKGGSQVPVKKNVATMADLLRARDEAFAE